MKTHAEKTQDNQNSSVSHGMSQKQSGGNSTFEFVDNRPEAVAQRKLQEMANNHLQAMELKAVREIVTNSHSTKQQEENHQGYLTSEKSNVQRLPKNIDGLGIEPGADVIQRCENHAYQHLQQKIMATPSEERLLNRRSSMVLAGHSRVRESQLAFIINTILPYSQLANIADTIDAMVEGLHHRTDYSRIAIILGVNARKGEEVQMEHAIRAVKGILNGCTFPIAIVKSTFSGNFPYGTMRNNTMHSDKTRLMTQAFTEMGFHPYLSFQDSDASSRRVGSDQGPHIFHAVERELAGIIPDEELRAPIRPLLVAGGYRHQKDKDLHRMTGERLVNEPLPGIMRDDIPKLLSNFQDEISEDMQIRDMYARIHPMLPYSPEPNLFIDATAAYHGDPESANQLMFGPNASEYLQLSRALANFNRMELEDYYGPLYEQAPDHVTETIQRPNDGNSKYIVSDKEDIKQQLMLDSQNNRHPLREQSFHSNYAGMAVATDLSRLAYGMLSKKSKKIPQSHDLRFIVDNLFAGNKKSNKKGVKLAEIRDELRKSHKKHKSLFPYMNQFVIHDEPSRSARSNFYQQRREKLGSKRGQKFNPALRSKFKTKPFKGLRYGAQKKWRFSLYTALAQETRALMRNEAFNESRGIHKSQPWTEDDAHIENLSVNALPHIGSNLTLRVRQWTKADGECGIYSLGIITGNQWNRRGLIQHLQQLPNPDQRDDAIARISGKNFTRWLSDDDIMAIASVLGIAGNLAIVELNHGAWSTMLGDPANAEWIIGGVPAELGGPNNHWVVLRKE